MSAYEPRLVFFFPVGSYVPGLLYVAEDEPDLLLYLPLLGSKFAVMSHACIDLVLGIELRASCLLIKHFAN